MVAYFFLGHRVYASPSHQSRFFNLADQSHPVYTTLEYRTSIRLRRLSGEVEQDGAAYRNMRKKYYEQ